MRLRLCTHNTHHRTRLRRASRHRRLDERGKEFKVHRTRYKDKDKEQEPRHDSNEAVTGALSKHGAVRSAGQPALSRRTPVRFQGFLVCSAGWRRVESFVHGCVRPQRPIEFTAT
jgi:hypothetical protein